MRLVAAFMSFALLASPALAARGGVLPLSADDGWLQFGNFVVLLFASAALVSVCAYALRSLSRRPILFLVMFSVSSLVATIVADKTNGVNNLPPMPMPPRSAPVVATVTEDDIARGWRVKCVTTNETISYTMPSNAVYVNNWHVHGASSSFGRNVVDFGSAGTPRPTGWSFPLGTNGAAFSSFWYFVDGRIRPKPKDAACEICAVGVPMSAVPGKSRLWAMADGDCRVLTWENFFLGGDTNAPVNAQICLFANGDFTTSSNEVETVCRRVNPDDWDGDGFANEKDENPLAYDGEFFGAANAMPTNANLDAYYQLDIAAVGALDFATIRVTCDGPSDLGDHVIIARTNQVCHVPLSDGGRLLRTQGTELPGSASVPAGDAVLLSAEYEALSESLANDDIVAAAVFTENMTGRQLTNETTLTVVRVELTPEVFRDGALHRHRVGIGEEVGVFVSPSSIGWTLIVNGNGSMTNMNDRIVYLCPFNAEENTISINMAGGVHYKPLLSVVEPTGVVAFDVRAKTYSDAEVGSAGWAGMSMDLYVEPLTVAFGQIEIAEVPEYGEGIAPTGYFATNEYESIWHHTEARGAGTWHTVRIDNMFLPDNAELGERLGVTPWTSGQITWRIPITWRRMPLGEYDYREPHEFGTPYYQLFNMNVNGTLRVTKFQDFWVERDPDGTRRKSQNVGGTL